MDENAGQHKVETHLLAAPTLCDQLDELAMRAARHLGDDTEVCVTCVMPGPTGSRRAAATGRLDAPDAIASEAGPRIAAMDGTGARRRGRPGCCRGGRSCSGAARLPLAGSPGRR